MNGIIIEKFQEWSRGLGEAESRAAVYGHIRDIPYAIIAELRDPITGPSRMLEINKGSCVPKHFLLAQAFALLNIPVKYVSYLFKWDDPLIKYPPELRSLIKKMPVSAHLACKAKINGKLILVDATWDLPLGRFGYPVNKTWDGFSDTLNAVTPIKEVLHESLEERLEFSSKLRSGYTREETAVYEELSGKLNAWLDSARG